MRTKGCCHLFLFFLLVGLASSSFIAYDGLDPHDSTGRRLLQQKAACPVNFENLNYTIITSKCKGPHYSPDVCCSSFKQLACPFADNLDDMKTDCASTLFSYINLYGKYPPGLFANLCKEGKDGLDCEEANEEQKKSQTNGVPRILSHGVVFMVAAVVAFLFNTS